MVTLGNEFVKDNFKKYFTFTDWRVAEVFDYVFYTYFEEGREYKKRFNWIKADKIRSGAFYAWSAIAKGKRDECAEGKMSFDEFKKWLSESKKKKGWDPPALLFV